MEFDANPLLQAEANEYLKGVLAADHADAANHDFTRVLQGDIADHGTGTRDFWRGFLESRGGIYMPDARCEDYTENPRRARPRLKIQAHYRYLDLFRDFLAEALEKNGFEYQAVSVHKGLSAWDLQGPWVQLIVEALYRGSRVSRARYGATALQIMAWDAPRGEPAWWHPTIVYPDGRVEKIPLRSAAHDENLILNIASGRVVHSGNGKRKPGRKPRPPV